MYITAINDEFEDNFKFLNNAINYIEQSNCVERERKERRALSIFAWKLLFQNEKEEEEKNKQAHTCKIVNLHWLSLHRYMQFFFSKKNYV